MRAAILYYSMTGNTAIAAQRIAQALPGTALRDMTAPGADDLDSLDVVGFASSTDFWSVPRFVEDFIASLPPRPGTPAFVVNTFGGVSGNTLPRLGELVSAKGFRVVAGHSLHMPGSYPPLRKMGITASNAPSTRDLARFDAFVAKLADMLASLESGPVLRAEELRITLVDRLFRAASRSAGREAMGDRYADEHTCTRCGTCAKGCPAAAIRLEPIPVFDAAACVGCWRCYNRCPSHAIRTKTCSGDAFYAGPTATLREKLDVG